MVSFVYYDLAFLVLFSISVAAFLYKNRKNLQVENKIILLYRTKMGLDTIDYVGKKHPKILHFLSDFVIIAGYLMMTASLLFFFAAMVLTFFAPATAKIPPIIPLVPYVDRLLPTGTLPPFYFTYWIIVIAVIAVCHEFAHGVFAKLRDIRIKSTGFGFIGPLLAAFVEIDEKQMEKKPISSQLAVLAAGSAANLMLWILFFGISAMFFTATFAPAGVNFSSYAVGQVNLSKVVAIDNQLPDRPFKNFYEFATVLEKLNRSSYEIMMSSGQVYIAETKTVSTQKVALGSYSKNLNLAVLPIDSPAVRAGLTGAIQKISAGNVTYSGFEGAKDIQDALVGFGPGQNLTIETTTGRYNLTLASHPENESRGFLGVGFNQPPKTTLGKVIGLFNYKDSSVNYIPKGGKTAGEMIIFVYHLLYWLTIINFFIMLFNMLPVGIVDGGRFFYLSALAVTKDKNKAEKWFTAVTYLMLLGFLIIMGTWFVKAFFLA